jgi:peptidoglycan/xylan/chitin deacetylase (PgdA/CDA1 family)
MPRTDTGFTAVGRSRTTRNELTRRSLISASVVLAGAAIVDVFHRPGRAAANASPTTATTRKPATSRSAQGRPVPATSARRHLPHQPQTAGSHGHTHSHGHASTHAHGPSEAHHRGNDHDRDDHVDLPPAKIRVRSRPVYKINELIHQPPKHSIALTVDDGPDPDWTPKVLHLLEKYRMQASFCVVGVHADAYPKLIRDIHKAGHILVNHSYTHVQPFNRQTEHRIVKEITKTQRSIERAAKVTPQLFRSPGGAWSHFIFRAVAAYDLIPLDWDVDPVDWERPGTSHIEHAMLKGRPGDIVLCHDGGGDRSETVRALRTVLPTWKHRGYDTIALIPPKSAEQPPKHSHKH